MSAAVFNTSAMLSVLVKPTGILLPVVYDLVMTFLIPMRKTIYNVYLNCKEVLFVSVRFGG